MKNAFFRSLRGYGKLQNVREKSGNFEVDDKWQPCTREFTDIFNRFNEIYMVITSKKVNILCLFFCKIGPHAKFKTLLQKGSFLTGKNFILLLRKETKVKMSELLPLELYPLALMNTV